VGRIAYATRRGGPTDEEKLAAKVAREYVDLLAVKPWFQFNYFGALKRVWTETAFGGRT